jgi:hypothetical protein
MFLTFLTLFIYSGFPAPYCDGPIFQAITGPDFSGGTSLERRTISSEHAMIRPGENRPKTAQNLPCPTCDCLET